MEPSTDACIDLSLLIREPAEAYHAKAGEFLTSHLLADYRKCPLLYRQRVLGLIERDDRPAYLIGDTAHVRILEGSDEFQRRFAVGGPINPKTNRPFGSNTVKFAQWAEAQGKPVLTAEQAELVERLAAGVLRNQLAVELLADGVAEGVARAEYCGVPCQIRIDWLSGRAGLIDLKSADDLDFFASDARRYGYVYQLAFYRGVLAEVVGRLLPCHLIGVEKKWPFRCGVWRVTEDALDQCARENADAIERLKDCRRLDAWPTGYEEIRVLDVA